VIDEEFGKVCEHGSLARSCRICELEKENAELRQLLAKERDDFGKKETELKVRCDNWQIVSNQQDRMLDKYKAVAQAAENVSRTYRFDSQRIPIWFELDKAIAALKENNKDKP
jgi:hypothetical protein